MTTETATAEAEIRAVIDRWAQALCARDIDAIMANCAPDMLSFDCHSQFQLKGAAAYRAFLEACFPYMQGPMTFDVHELAITAHGSLAFCRYIARSVTTGLDGAEHSCWLRATACLRKMNGTWLIVHGHCSVPFNPGTGMAMLDRAPANDAA